MNGKTKESVMKSIYILCACFSVLALLVILIFIFYNGIKPMFQIGFSQFLLGKRWLPSSNFFGIFPMILTTLYLGLLAMFIGVPLGILTAVYLVYYCPKKMYSSFKKAVELLAGIPSIIYGFFGLVAIVPFIQKYTPADGKSVLTGSILLGIMVLPTIISIADASLKQVPRELVEGSLALGATMERSIMKVALPAAKSGIFAAIILAYGRAIGETMAVIMVLGNQAVMPHLFKGARSLTANVALELGYAQDLHREALIATAVVLFLLILLMNALFIAASGGLHGNDRKK